MEGDVFLYYTLIPLGESKFEDGTSPRDRGILRILLPRMRKRARDVSSSSEARERGGDFGAGVTSHSGRIESFGKNVDKGESIQVIGKAKVPIIKFLETVSNIPFDIRAHPALILQNMDCPKKDFFTFAAASETEAAAFIKRVQWKQNHRGGLCIWCWKYFRSNES